MKALKIITAILQLIASIYLGYILGRLIVALVDLYGIEILKNIITSKIGILCLIDLVLGITAIVNLCVFKTTKVKVWSFISLLPLIGYCILISFNFELYGLAAVCILGSLNLSLILGYNNRV